MKGKMMTLNLPDRERSALSRAMERAVSLSGLPRSEFARRIGISPSTLNLWIRDVTVPSERNLTRVARLLGVEQDALQNGLPELFDPESA